MPNEFVRTELLLGTQGVDRLKQSYVAIFGVGGVGSYAAEALARSGVGRLALFDDDVICLTNINRQLIALHSTVGKPKIEVMKARILDINPHAAVETHQCFYNVETADQFDLANYDYIIDAIDTVSSKLLLIERAQAADTPIISAMGAGNKLDPTRFEVADIFETSVCPLAKVMRRELKVRGITHLKVVYSKEEPIRPQTVEAENCEKNSISPEDTQSSRTVRRQVPGSISFVPSVSGLILAGEVIKALAADEGERKK